MKTAYGHLTYCSNIHSGESWKEHFSNLQQHIPAIRKAIAPGEPFGIGLRLSNIASVELAAEDNLDELKQWLQANNCYVYTMNGFPYGGFHHKRVKENVHSPDWATRERVDYTNRLFGLLAALLPHGMDGGVSTSPLTYRHWHRTEEEKQRAIDVATRHVLEVAAHRISIRQQTGKLLHLDIEPEPDGMLESGTEFLDWYLYYLLPMGVSCLQEKFGFDKEEAVSCLKEHVCICYDICHFAIGFEDHSATLQQLKKHGIKTGKIQISAALKATLAQETEKRMPVMNAFNMFNEPVYLHQVVARQKNGAMLRYPDLPQALEDAENVKVEEWRAHYHVPLFLNDYGLLQSTQEDIELVLDIQRQQPFTEHLEIETYTWEVLPENVKLPLSDSILRELQWVKNLLQ